MDTPKYGLWIAKEGWLKAGESDVWASDDISFAKEVANIICAKVRRIDGSWKDLERYYLEQEQKDKSLWHIFKTYLQRNNSK